MQFLERALEHQPPVTYEQLTRMASRVGPIPLTKNNPWEHDLSLLGVSPPAGKQDVEVGADKIRRAIDGYRHEIRRLDMVCACVRVCVAPLASPCMSSLLCSPSQPHTQVLVP